MVGWLIVNCERLIVMGETEYRPLTRDDERDMNYLTLITDNEQQRVTTNEYSLTNTDD